MVIHSRHRNYKLALRHLRELKRKHGQAKIIARRNSQGRFSKRGQFYTFDVGKFGWLVDVGYDSKNPGNSYYLTVRINTHKRISEEDTFDLVHTLAASGHFDSSDVDGAPRDMSWATFYNSQIVIKKNIRSKVGTAILVDFQRS